MNYRRQKPKATRQPRTMNLSTIALPAPRYSWVDAWAELSPAQQAQLGELAEVADLAMGYPRGAYLYGVLDMIAQGKNNPAAELFA